MAGHALVPEPREPDRERLAARLIALLERESALAEHTDPRWAGRCREVALTLASRARPRNEKPGGR